MGSALGYKRIDVGGPPAIAITLSIVIAAICYNKRFGQQCRPIFLAVTLAPGVIFAFLLGSILGDLSFAYFVWLNLLLLVSCIDLQVFTVYLQLKQNYCILNVFFLHFS